MGSLFTDFFTQHAACLSAAEQAEALEAAATALLAEPTLVRSYDERQGLLRKGGLLPTGDGCREFTALRDAASKEWIRRAQTLLGLRAIARELADAAQELAAAHEFCGRCWADCDRCCCGEVEDGPAFGSDRYAEAATRRCGLGETR